MSLRVIALLQGVTHIWKNQMARPGLQSSPQSFFSSFGVRSGLQFTNWKSWMQSLRSRFHLSWYFTISLSFILLCVFWNISNFFPAISPFTYYPFLLPLHRHKAAFHIYSLWDTINWFTSSSLILPLVLS